MFHDADGWLPLGHAGSRLAYTTHRVTNRRRRAPQRQDTGTEGIGEALSELRSLPKQHPLPSLRIRPHATGK